MAHSQRIPQVVSSHRVALRSPGPEVWALCQETWSGAPAESLSNQHAQLHEQKTIQSLQAGMHIMWCLKLVLTLKHIETQPDSSDLQDPNVHMTVPYGTLVRWRSWTHLAHQEAMRRLKKHNDVDWQEDK